ncbi:MAG: Asp-tRNA(Asn)/Glu-tRNA(Gln) amidotransferase subunit GatB [Patescibacteria group bacterium]
MFDFIIGLEIHLELKTKTKMFCCCESRLDLNCPNTNICPVCTGQPGALPTINHRALEQAISLGLALNGRVAKNFKFDRKNYFYPDLPKGYQISQYDHPIIASGCLEIDLPKEEHRKRIRLNRIHLEEDTAKLSHFNDYTLIDFNRSGIPLIEIVTEPDIKSPEEAKIFLQELQLIVRYLGISDADMEKGQMRCDANVNISFNKDGREIKTPITEIKNLNSFKAIEKASNYEADRQYKEYLAGGEIIKRSGKITVGWDENKEKVIIQRTKEGITDYRYFPEPDIPPFDLSGGDFINLDKLKSSLPELPCARRERFERSYDLSKEEAKILTSQKIIADFTEKVVSELKAWLVSLETVENSEQEIWAKHRPQLLKLTSSWIINRLFYLFQTHNENFENLKITPENFAEFIILIYENKVSSTIAQKLLEEMFITGVDVDKIIQSEKFKKVDNTAEIENIAQKVIDKNAEMVKAYQNGKVNTLQFLIGQAMKESKGRADPTLLKQIFENKMTK